MSNDRILLYTDAVGPSGVARLNHALLVALINSGYSVTTAVGRHESPLLSEQKSLGISQKWISFDAGRDLSKSLHNNSEARTIFSESSPDLIVFSDISPVSNLAAKRVAAQMGIRFVIIEGVSAAHLAAHVANLLPEISGIYRTARKVFTGSARELALICQHYQLPVMKGQVLHGGVPAPFYAPRNLEMRQALRSQWNVPDDAMLCIMAGRIANVREHQYQLEAVNQLRQDPCFSRLHFIWLCLAADEPVLTRAITSFDLQDRVAVVVDRWELPEILDAADLFILTSELEGSTRLVMEAMAKSVAVIAIGGRGSEEVLGGCGRLISDPQIDLRGTAGELRQAIQQLTTDADLRNRFAIDARARVSEMFTETAAAQQFICVVQNAMALRHDYITPGFAVVRPDRAFPHMVMGDPSNHPYEYLRRDIPHHFYCDRRSPDIGFVSRDEASILYNTAKMFNGKRALELGCWLGWSACHLALGGVTLDVIDPLLAKPDIFGSVRESLLAAGVLDQVNLMAGYSPAKVTEIAAAERRRWHLFFIDADHTHPSPLNDSIACEALAETDALVLFHDLAAPDVGHGLNYFRSKGWNTMVYQTMQIMGVAWRGNVQPVRHVPDPDVRWELPAHLSDYPVSGVLPNV